MRFGTSPNPFTALRTSTYRVDDLLIGISAEWDDLSADEQQAKIDALAEREASATINSL
jgi:hypothetical protein